MTCPQKISDSVFYQPRNKFDTLETDMWQSIYYESYHSAYDTSWLPLPVDLFTAANNYYSDTIPMGIMNFAFYKLKDDAMTTNTYFDFDTVNTILTDKFPRPSWPYLDSNMFAAAPMQTHSTFGNPVYHVDPQFILFDNFNAGYYLHGEGILKIDFDDGNGWIVFDPTVITDWQVQYATNGYKLIQTGMFDPTGHIIFYSMSTIFIIQSTAGIQPDETIDGEGLVVGVYNGCNNSGVHQKTLIYLSGIDPVDFIPSKNRTVAMIYSDIFQNDKINQLRNQGYRLIIVDYVNSRIDIRFNALYFVNLLEHLKCDLPDNDFQQFVVMGESMGGLVARYALTYMETSDYQAQNTLPFFVDAADINNAPYLASHPAIFTMPTFFCKKNWMHNTRLFITYDTPHQGANIPMSIQCAYRTAMQAIGRFTSFDATLYANAFNILLDGQAAQQMLIYHIDTKSGSPWFYNYYSMPDKGSFFNQLYSMGNYPRYAKVTAMSNGSLSGAMQTNYTSGNPRFAGDKLLDFNTEIFARFLWLKLPIFGAGVLCETNPNGNGHIYRAKAGWWSIHIKLKWFGIKINVGYNSLLFEDESANLKSFCSNAGGFTGDPSFVDPTNSTPSTWNLSNNYWILNLFHYQRTVSPNGCITFDAHLGLNGFLSTNFNYSLCSDGLHFGFVPTQSALDYGVLGTAPLNHNIQTEPINTKLSLVRADAVIGIPGNGNYINRNHVGSQNMLTGKSYPSFRNDNIFNLTGVSAIPPSTKAFTYYSCAGQNDDVERGFLNLEIGDEEFYLENFTLPWQADYTPQFDIHVNDRNPYYEYPSGPGSPNYKLGIYSKEAPFLISTTGQANFYYDAGSPAIGYNYSPPLSGTYQTIKGPVNMCCTNYLGQRFANGQQAEHQNAESFLNVFPNPNNGNQVVLNFRFKNSGQATLFISNLVGQQIYSQPLKVKDASIETTSVIDLNSAQFAPGFYLIKITNGSESNTAKLLISK